jgi:hypothetical protein
MFVLLASILGLLVAGALAKFFPDRDLIYAQTGLFSLCVVIGLGLELFLPGKRGPRQ